MTVDSNDLYAAPGDETEGTVYTAMGGGDWADIAGEQAERGDEVLVINMGPQHPSTHGVLRLMVECDGETVTSIRPGIGFLHTGIEKNMEYRSWTQGTTFVTRMDYVSPLFNEAAYCLAVERLLGIEDQIPQRASDIRVLMMELCRIASHLIAIGTGGMEIGALTVMTIGFREREMILDFFEAVTGLRMNHAYIRPGGVAIDLPETGIAQLHDLINWLEKHLPEYAAFCNENPIFKGRMVGIGHQDLSRLLRPRCHRPDPAVDRLRLGPAQAAALLRLRDLRLRRDHLGHLRRLRPLPGAPRRDVGEPEDRQAGHRPPRGLHRRSR